MADIVVLTVDDDETQLELVDVALKSNEEHEAQSLRAQTLAEGLAIFRSRRVDLVIADYLLPDGTGIELLEEVKRVNPLVGVIVITGHQSIEQAVRAMKRGADDYLVKPINAVHLNRIVNRSMEGQGAFRSEAHVPVPHLHGRSHDLVYRSRAMADALDLALRGARSSASVLIRGESGTGKELFARIIHDASPRHEAPFVPVNVAALPESLIESELFGHRKGAFTGATQAREGRFQAADGGTLFFDELADIPLSVQVKLLRAVQFRQVEPVGGDKAVDVDVRIVAATHRDLESMVRAGTFREDLYYRLNVVSLTIPPLRDRKEDIPALVEHVLARLAADSGSEVTGLTPPAMDRLMRYDFPGNVRELENLVERAVVLARGTVVTEHDLPDVVVHEPDEPRADGPAVAPSTRRPVDGTLDERLAEVERALIVEALEETGGNQSLAARRLGIGERRLRSRLERLGIANVYRAP